MSNFSKTFIYNIVRALYSIPLHQCNGEGGILLPTKAVYPILRLILVVIASIACYFLIKYAIIYLYPFLLAVVISYLMQKPISFLETHAHVPRKFAWFIVLVTGIAGIFVSIIFLTAELMRGSAFLAEHLPRYFQFFSQFVENLFETTLLPLYHKFISLFHSLSNDHQELILQGVSQFAEKLTAAGSSIMHQALLQIPSFLAQLPNSLTIILFTILATIFISKDWDRLIHAWRKMSLTFTNGTLQNVFYQFKKTLFGYVRAQFILVFITACIIGIGLLILQIKHAVTIAILTSIVDFLPFIGTGLVFIPWIVYLFFTGNYPLTIFISLLYMVVIVQRQLSEPKIVADSIGLPPLATLFCLFIAWQFWGLLGLFIAPLILVVLTTLIRAGVLRALWVFIKG